MTRKRKFSISRTRRRRALFRRVATYEVDTIDRFRAHVRNAAAAERHSIQQRADKLPAEVQELLADDLVELDEISNLADQLAIVALYRVVELTTGRIVVHKFGSTASGKAFNIKALSKFLKQQHVNIELIPHYRAINELRLLNNAIKHAGHVSTELANKYPRWKQGAKLAGLDAAYERLKKRVPSYIFRFGERVKL